MRRSTKKYLAGARKRRSSYVSKKRVTAKAVNRKVMKLQKAIEWKHVDNTLNYSISTTPTILNLTNITQGDGDSNRDGDKITISSVQLRLTTWNGDAPYNNLRVVVFKWPDILTAPVLEDLFILPPGLGQVPQTWPYNVDRIRARRGFKILYDRCYTRRMANDGGIGVVNLFKKFKHRTNLQYVGGGATGVHLYIFMVSDSLLSPHPAITGTARINYCDL